MEVMLVGIKLYHAPQFGGVQLTLAELVQSHGVILDPALLLE